MRSFIAGLNSVPIDDFIHFFGDLEICRELEGLLRANIINPNKLEVKLVIDNIILDPLKSGHGITGYKFIFVPINYLNYVCMDKKMSSTATKELVSNELLNEVSLSKHHYVFIYSNKELIGVRVVVPNVFKNHFNIISNQFTCDCGTKITLFRDIGYKNVFYSENVIYAKCNNCL